jgi:hypothetical protein
MTDVFEVSGPLKGSLRLPVGEKSDCIAVIGRIILPHIRMLISTLLPLGLEKMDQQAIFEELLVILEQNGVVIRTEPLCGGGGGLCKLKDKTIFFVDSEASAAEMAMICAQAVADMTDTDSIYLKPQVRDFIEKAVHRVDRRGDEA